MPIQNGFYDVQFSAAGKPGEGGTIAVEDGRVLGGDSQFLYAGVLREAGNEIEANLAITARGEDSESVFGTIGKDFKLYLSGTAIGNGFTVAGTATAPAGASINI